uniref:THH1/TOM1/TOM3 domain-containing protein n=1 Tax=Vannella robusta TaxID=1487602 RepID=A0A7S4IRS0_9EUKA
MRDTQRNRNITAGFYSFAFNFEMAGGLWQENWESREVIVWASTAFVLALIFFILFCVSTFQLTRFLYNRHRLISYQLGFFVCCFMWSGVRSIFFLFLTDWSLVAMNILFWLPVLVQFIAFSLLVVYYVQQLYRETWQRVRKLVLVIYILTNLGFIIFVITYMILSYQYFVIKDEDEPAWLDASAQVLSGVIFFILVVVLGYYGCRVFLKVRKGEIAVPFQLKGASNNLILTATGLIVIIYTIRSIYDFITAFDVWKVDIDSGFSFDDFVVFGMYFSWEVVPCVILLILFWSVGKKHRGVVLGSKNTQKSADEYSLDEEPSGFFNNDFRYDSDSDENSILYPSSYATPASFNTPYATSPAEALGK